jgi:hypothetical protein
MRSKDMTEQKQPYRAAVQLYNYRTGHLESVWFPTTDQEAVLYIPQSPEAQNLYSAQRAAGKSIAQAMSEVLAYRRDQSQRYETK